MQLLQPIFLLASVGILFPLAIHLWNRKKGDVVEMGSLRFLRELPKEQINSIELTQRRLLVLRSLIVLCLALLLAGLVIEQPADKTKKIWILVEGELLENPSFKNQLENFQREEVIIYVIEDTLKKYNLEQEPIWQKTSTDLDYAELLSVIPYQQAAPDSIVIFTQGKLQNFSGIPKSTLPISWVVSPQETNSPKKNIVAARYSGKDSLKLILAETKANFTAHHSKTTSINDLKITKDTLIVEDNIQLPINRADLKVSLVASDTNRRAVKLLQAAFKTLSQYTSIPIYVKVSKPKNVKKADAYFLVDMKEVPKNLNDREITMVFSGNLALGNGLYVYSKSIYPQIHLDTKADQPSASLLNLLAAQLFTKHKTFDQRRLDEKQVQQFSSFTNQKIRNSSTLRENSSFQSMNYILLGFGFLFIVIERFISSRR